MPDPQTIKAHPHLKFLAPLLNDPNLLHFNRRSISAGVAAGVFAAFIPLPVQMILAVALAIWFRGNIAVAAGFTWISNPLTYWPIYGLCYWLGVFFLGTPVDAHGAEIPFELEAILTNIWTLGKPLLFGCVLIGIVCSLISYHVVNMLWRLHIIKLWKDRRERRKACRRAKKTQKSRAE